MFLATTDWMADWTPPELRHVPKLTTVSLVDGDGTSSKAMLDVLVSMEGSANPPLPPYSHLGYSIMG